MTMMQYVQNRAAVLMRETLKDYESVRCCFFRTHPEY